MKILAEMVLGYMAKVGVLCFLVTHFGHNCEKVASCQKGQ